MTAKKISSTRKRSRPIKPKKMNPDIKIIGILIIIAVIIIISVFYILIGGNSDQNNDDVFEGNSIAVFNTTLGTFKIELFEDKMPETCDNFIKLSNEGFYNGMNFYRVLDDFMIQAGRYYPDGSEKQSPYGNINFEESDVKHVDGAISMASTGDKMGGNAEFFICDGEQKGLDGRYAAFGVTIEGLDIVHDIAAVEQDNSHPAGGGKPYTDIVINYIKIE
jgi:peptidyl-prolyl cis-trans isomerase A (cyclophilin A)